MLDMDFPTIDPADPLKLTKEEQELLHTLALSFKHSGLLHKHIRFLYSNGALYKCYNGNLLYHGCIPMREDGSFETMDCDGRLLSGKALVDYIGEQVQKAYFL